jgi:hypothetical protein
MTFFTTKHEDAKGGAFEPITPGEYEVIVTKAEVTKAKTSGNPMIKVQATIRDDVGQDFQKRILFDNIVFADNTIWKGQQVLKALDIPDGTEINSIEEFAELISYKAAKMKVKHEEYQGKINERIEYWEVSDHGLGGASKSAGADDPFANTGDQGSIDISDDDLPF